MKTKINVFVLTIKNSSREYLIKQRVIINQQSFQGPS